MVDKGVIAGGRPLFDDLFLPAGLYGELERELVDIAEGRRSNDFGISDS